MKDNLKTLGYICPGCEDEIIDALELDQVFGKQDRERKCSNCGHTFHQMEAEKVYRESDFKQFIGKRFRAVDQSFNGVSPGTPAHKELLGRRKMLRDIVKMLGWDRDFNDELGFIECSECGNRNWQRRSDCMYCNEKLEREQKNDEEV